MKGVARISQNQLRMTVLKACVGTGVARGNSEDMADAVLFLAQMGANSFQSLIECLTQFDADLSPRSPAVNYDEVSGETLSVLQYGPSLIDLVQVGKPFDGTVDCPILLAGLAAYRGHEQELSFLWNDRQVSETLIHEVASLKSTGRIRLTCATQLEQSPSGIVDFRQPQEAEWTKLCRFADAILVPADAASRADAGAGNTDND